MTAYSHFLYSPQRHRTERVKLSPPLKLKCDLSLNNVGYLPKISEGRIFVPCVDGTIQAYEEKMFDKLWTFRLPDRYRPLPPFHGDILITPKKVITRFSDQLYILDVETGKTQNEWCVPPFNLRAATIIGSKLLSIYVTKSQKMCFCYDIEQGEIVWEYALNWLPDVISADGDRVFLNDKKGIMTCLDFENGKEVWSASVRRIGQHWEDSKDQTSEGEVVGVPMAQDGLVIVPVKAYHVLAFTVKMGELKWRQKISILNPNTLTFYPDGRLYVIDYNHYYSLDAITGQIVDSREIGENLSKKNIQMVSRFATSDDFLYFSDIYQGILVAMEKNTGKIIWTYMCDSEIPFFNEPVILNDRLYILDLRRNLYVFEEDKIN